MSRVTHFEIQAENPDRAIAFYRNVFGWTFTSWGPQGQYWLISTGPDSEPGINGGLLPRRGPPPVEGQPVNAYVCTVAVANVDDAMAGCLNHGGSLALAKMGIPGVGWLGYCKDSEGNILGMMQADPQAR